MRAAVMSGHIPLEIVLVKQGFFDYNILLE